MQSPVSDVAGVACSILCLTGATQQHKQSELAALLHRQMSAQQQSDDTDTSMNSSSSSVSIAGSTVLARCYTSCHVDVILVGGGMRPQWKFDPSYHIVNATSSKSRHQKQKHHNSSSTEAISYDAPVIECFDLSSDDADNADDNGGDNEEETATEEAQRALIRKELQQGGLMPHMVRQCLYSDDKVCNSKQLSES
jgi:hypothetical protein